jgi:hypothetical protein
MSAVVEGGPRLPGTTGQASLVAISHYVPTVPMIHSPEQPLPHIFTAVMTGNKQRSDDQSKRAHDNPHPQVSHGRLLSIAETSSSSRDGI